MPESARPQAIELLTVDMETGHAIEGPKYPADLGAAAKWLDGAGVQRIAHRHTFFAYDQSGQPDPSTVTAFYVRDYMERDGAPGRSALLAALERIESTRVPHA